MKGHISINEELCKGCEICIFFCPTRALSLSTRVNASGYPVTSFAVGGNCTGCAACALVCPEVAIEVYRD